MRQVATFALQIEPATLAAPPRVCVVVSVAPTGGGDAVPLTSACLTLDEMEGQINGLQDELDLLRAEARRVFAENAGHG